MKSEVLSVTQETILPEIALVIFFVVFCVALYRAYRPGAKAHYQKIASIVLDDAPVSQVDSTTSRSLP